MFIGRKAELDFLKSEYEKQGGSIVLLYGRRNMGKTELLQQFCKDKSHFYYCCGELPQRIQLETFEERIEKNTDWFAVRTADFAATQSASGQIEGNVSDKCKRSFDNWKQVFLYLSQMDFSEKQIIVLDEFSNLMKGESNFLLILKEIWEEKLKDKNIMLVFISSATALMEKKVFAGKASIAGMFDGILKLQELEFYEAARFLPDYSATEKLYLYGLLGGVPCYLAHFHNGLSVDGNVKRQLLRKSGCLYREAGDLMHQELREPAVYNAVMAAIACGCFGLNEIHEKTGMEKTTLSVYLKNLLEQGLVYREFPMGEQEGKRGGVQRSLYRMTDHFLRFWFTFLFPNLSELEAGRGEKLWETIIEPALDQYAEYTFRCICLRYLERKSRMGQLSFEITNIGEWQKGKRKADIVAVDRKKQHVLIGECCYKNRAAATADFNRMKRKFTLEDSSPEITYCMFSKNGFSDEVIKRAEQENVMLVSMEMLLEE